MCIEMLILKMLSFFLTYLFIYTQIHNHFQMSEFGICMSVTGSVCFCWHCSNPLSSKHSVTVSGFCAGSCSRSWPWKQSRQQRRNVSDWERLKRRVWLKTRYDTSSATVSAGALCAQLRLWPCEQLEISPKASLFQPPCLAAVWAPICSPQ